MDRVDNSFLCVFFFSMLKQQTELAFSSLFGYFFLHVETADGISFFVIVWNILFNIALK